MSLKVVVDNSNVATLPIANIADIPGALRKLADNIEAGEHGDVVQVISLVLYEPSGMTVCAMAPYADAHQLSGICEAAKFRILADDMIADE